MRMRGRAWASWPACWRSWRSATAPTPCPPTWASILPTTGTGRRKTGSSAASRWQKIVILTYLVILGRCLPMIPFVGVRFQLLYSPLAVSHGHLRLGGSHHICSVVSKYRQFWGSVHFLQFLSHLGPSYCHPQLYLRRNVCFFHVREGCKLGVEISQISAGWTFSWKIFMKTIFVAYDRPVF